jgi:hypothetical protein
MMNGEEKPKTMQRLAMRFLVVLAIILAGAAVRMVLLAGKAQIFHDECDSFVLALGHAPQYFQAEHGAYPAGQWVPARVWKDFLRVDQRFCFDRIRYGCAVYDNHPPLYFWLLHLWMLLTGVTPRSGVLLNVLTVMATTAALYGFARFLTASHWEAAFVAAVWALSPVVVTVAFEARQYELKALITVLFVWQSLRMIRNDPTAGWGNRAAILVTALGGMLTHYYFSFVIAATGFYALVRLARRDKRRLVAWTALTLAGCLLLFVAHPGTLGAVGRQQQAIPAFKAENLPARAYRVGTTLLEFAAYPRSLKAALLAALIVGFGAAAVWVARHREKALALYRANAAALIPVYYFVFVGGLVILLYLAFFSHPYAMRDKYLAAAWPFCAFIPALLLRLVPRRKAVVAGLFLALLASQGLWAAADLWQRPPGSDPAAVFAGHARLLCDDPVRGFFPRVFLHAPDDTLVFAATVGDLLRKPDAWLNDLGPRAVYVSDSSKEFGNEDKVEQVLSLVRPNYAATFRRGGIYGVGEVFVLDRCAASGASQGRH